MTVIWSLIGFIVVMGLIVTIHEWGHYQVARWFNIKVTTFSIGFGRPIYKKQGVETCFQIGMIPLGGYVKFVDEREGPVPIDDQPRAFNRQSVYKRFAVVLAGPLVNLLFAWFAFSLMYVIGVSGLKPVFNKVLPDSPIAQVLPKSILNSDQAWSIHSVNHQVTPSWQTVHQAVLSALVNQTPAIDMTLENLLSGERLEIGHISTQRLDLNNPEQNWLNALGIQPYQIPLPAVLGKIISGGPAEQAGLQSKDRVLAVNNQSVASWTEFVEQVQALPNQQILVSYQRDTVVFETQVLLGEVLLKDGQKVGRIGVGVDVDKEVMQPYMTVIRYGVIDGIVQGYHRGIDLLQMSLVMMQRMLFGEVSLQNLSGPLSIAQFSGQAIQTGMISFLSLLGLLSLSIGILNLLPIPVLDGGHLVYYLVEMVKGSPVSERVMTVGQAIGLVLIIVLTFVALFNDVIRITHG